MAKQNTKTNRAQMNDLEKSILHIIDALQPITTEDIWLELNENSDSLYSLSEIESHLDLLQELNRVNAKGKYKNVMYWKIAE